MVEVVVAAQAAAVAQWRLHQQRLAAQQRAKVQAQAALAMAHARSGKKPREEGNLSKLDGDCTLMRAHCYTHLSN